MVCKINSQIGFVDDTPSIGKGELTNVDIVKFNHHTLITLNTTKGVKMSSLCVENNSLFV